MRSEYGPDQGHRVTDEGNVSTVPIAGKEGSSISRRRILQNAAAAAVGIVVARVGTSLPALADGTNVSKDDPHDLTILRFSRMAGIQKPFVGNGGVFAFRGIQGGGAPWVISAAKGSLTSDGHVVVRVRGLVLDPAATPAPSGGTNPLPSFMAIVSGLSTDSLQPINLTTPLFPASKAGDADIEATLTLPHPFFAPIIFVTSPLLGTPPMPRWLAVTGGM